MRKLLSLIILLLMIACSQTGKHDYEQLIADEIETGNFTQAVVLIDTLVEQSLLSENRLQHYLFTKDSLHRVALDFNKNREDVLNWIEQNYGFTPTDSQLEKWEQEKALEFKIIDGEKRYFRNAAPNLFRVNAEARAMLKNETPKSDVPSDQLLVEALQAMKKDPSGVFYHMPPVTVSATYTLTIDADAVSNGELLRAWLPFPRTDLQRQYDVKLIAASQSDYILSENKTEHNSIYMEQLAERGKPAVFWVNFEFTSRGQWFDLAHIGWKNQNIDSDIYKKYTAERNPHLLFTSQLKSVTDSVTRNVETPLEIVQSCYRYIAENYPWASAIEYSTIPNIPEYALKYQKGDCGQVALLLIAMLRYKGIPARWQSGWMVHPGEVNLHDWAEFYIENVGWVPIDISFARGAEINHPIGREFFMSGIDSYRLYLNSDYGGKFYPEKKFPRSETVDFQRGEVETENSNLYFDKWRYRMEVEYK